MNMKTLVSCRSVHKGKLSFLGKRLHKPAQTQWRLCGSEVKKICRLQPSSWSRILNVYYTEQVLALSWIHGLFFSDNFTITKSGFVWRLSTAVHQHNTPIRNDACQDTHPSSPQKSINFNTLFSLWRTHTRTCCRVTKDTTHLSLCHISAPIPWLLLLLNWVCATSIKWHIAILYCM